MRNGTGTLADVSPRSKDEPPAEVLDQLRAIRDSNAKLKRLVLRALAEGGSVRVVAEASGKSPFTIQQWKNDAAKG